MGPLPRWIPVWRREEAGVEPAAAREAEGFRREWRRVRDGLVAKDLRCVTFSRKGPKVMHRVRFMPDGPRIRCASRLHRALGALRDQPTGLGGGETRFVSGPVTHEAPERRRTPPESRFVNDPLPHCHARSGFRTPRGSRPRMKRIPSPALPRSEPHLQKESSRRAGAGMSVVRPARLELATDGLEVRYSIH